MAKCRPTFEWAVMEDEVPWPQPNVEPTRPGCWAPPAWAEGTRGESAERLLFTQEQWLAVLLFLLAAGGWLWHTQARQATIKGELHEPLMLAVRATHTPEQAAVSSSSANAIPGNDTSMREMQAVEPERPGRVVPHLAKAANRIRRVRVAPEFVDLHVTIQEADTAEQTTLRMHVVDFQADRALVEVVTRDAGGEQIYRERRVYRRTEEGWRRTASAGVVWGAWQTLETAYFAIRYRPMDASAVSQAAERLDLRYAQLRHDFGLLALVVPTQGAAKLAIEVMGDQLPPFASTLEPAASTVAVPSPALLQVPVGLTEAAVLDQALIYALVGLAVQEVAAQQPEPWRQNQYRRSPLLNALRLWAL